MVAVEDLVETAVEEEAEEEVGEPEAEGEVEVALKAAEAVDEEEDLKGETVRALEADLHPRGQEEAEEEDEVLPVGARAEAQAEAPEISLIDACKMVPAEVVDRKMPRLAAPVVLTV